MAQSNQQFGTGYVSFSDYMRGNQDAIQRSNDRISDQALSGLNTEVDKFHQLADTAAGHTSDAFRSQMNDQAGFDTGDAYRQVADYNATKAAHPEFNFVTPGGQAPDEGAKQGNALLREGENPLIASTDPYDVTQFKGDEGKASAWIGNQSYGKAANDQETLAQNKANDVQNLGNWGGVFDSYRQANKGMSGYGAAGAGFDAVLAGGGLAGTADKGKQIAAGMDPYIKAAIHSHAGDADFEQAGYKGNDRYVKPNQDQTLHPTGGYGVGEGNQADYGQPSMGRNPNDAEIAEATRQSQGQGNGNSSEGNGFNWNLDPHPTQSQQPQQQPLPPEDDPWRTAGGGG